MKVAIIGGGIAGLATAYYLQKLGNGSIDYVLIESTSRFGGKIASDQDNGFVVEGGPDSFHALKVAGYDLCRELGLEDDIIGTNTAARKVFVWTRGMLRQMPEGVMLIIPTKITPFLKSRLITWPGKIRMGFDAFIPRKKDDGDESLAHFVRRRLGNEALDIIAEPMVAGIYVADAEHMSLKSTFPRFLDMEKQYGSLLRGILTQKIKKPKTGNNGTAPAKAESSTPGKAPNSNFITLRGGLQELTKTIIDNLKPESLLTNRKVATIQTTGNGYELVFDDGERLEADAVVFATPTFVTSEIVKEIDPKLAKILQTIRYVSTATVSLGFKRSEIGHDMSGFGFVVPRSEKRRVIACAWSSTKFNNRAPDGHVLLRCFVGGARAEHLADLDEASLITLVREEVRDAMGITATPVFTKVYRWNKANPQYDVGHQDRVAEIEQMTAQHKGMFMVGAAFHGVGVPDCIADAKNLVKKISANK